MSASAAFEAQYTGACARCRGDIDVGDLVRYVDDELVHFRHDPKRKPDVICDTCWLTKPCDCD